MKKVTVCVHLLDYVLRYASEKGLDRESICSRAGLPLSVFENPDARIGAAAFAAIWQHISRRLRDEMLGLKLGRSLQHFPFGHIAASVMLNSGDLLSAFQNLIRYHNLMSDIGRPSLTPDENGRICFAVRPRDEAFFHDIQYVVFVFAMVVSLLRYLGDNNNLHPVSVEFPGSVCGPDLSRFFKTEILEHRPVCQMRFRRKDLAGKILLSNPDLLPFLEQSADRRLAQFEQAGTWAGRVKDALESTANTGRLTIGTVADSLHLTARTLQNYLKKENTGFRRLYMEFRRQKAKQLLCDPAIPVIEIAFFLGFSEQSAFHHAFKKWTGETPVEYRLGRNPGIQGRVLNPDEGQGNE